MSLDENKMLVRRWIEDVWHTGNLAAIEEVFAPTYSVNGEFVGLDGVKGAVRWLHATFPDAGLTIDDLIAADDQVVVSWVLRGTQQGEFMGIPATNKQATLAGINIYRIADGKIVSNTERVDVLGLLRQLGAQIAPGEMGSPV